ncbi:MAG: hypothetical protein K0S70_208 [Microbacterium sp.]|jgi:hypothetical protein|nr:hypothetical protein [Microbacterium sp.]
MARLMWVRVRDRDTRHEYDLREDDPRIGVGVDRVSKKAYPPAHLPRRPKHYLSLAALPGAVTEAPQTGTNTEEAHRG